MQTFSSKLYESIEWVTRFAYLQLLWILGTFAGLIIFGIYPATGAVFSVTRQWLQGNSDKKLLPMFISYYRQDFVKTNLLGTWVTFLLLLIYLNVFYLQNQASLLAIPFLAFLFIISLYLLYVFPVYAHFEYSVGEVIKNAFLFPIVKLSATLAQIVTSGLLIVLYFLFPALAVIFGMSLFAFLTTWNARFTFHNVQSLTFYSTGRDSFDHLITEEDERNQDRQQTDDQRCSDCSPVGHILADEVLNSDRERFILIGTDERIHKDEFIPVVDHVDDDDGRQNRCRHRQNDSEKQPVDGATIHNRRLFDLSWKRVIESEQNHHRNRQVVGRIGQDDRDRIVNQIDVQKHAEQGNDGGVDRDHQPYHEQPQHQFIELPIHPRNRKCCHTCEQSRQDNGDHGDPYTVEKVETDSTLPHFRIVFPQPFFRKGERIPTEDFPVAFQGK